MNKKIILKRIIIIFGLLIVPLIYSFFYLKAFWNPYGKLEELPVAVVNEDIGGIINSNQKNLGEELKNKLTENNKLNYIFTDKENAYDGLINGKYYATITIPENFTQNVSTAAGTDKTPSTIVFSPNEGANYLATQILNSAITELKNEVKSNVSSEVVTGLTEKLNEVPIKLEEVNVGVNKLYEGTTNLASGTLSLMNGVNTLNDKYSIFNSGLYSLQSAVKTLNDGNKQLNTGINSAVSGVKQLDEATKDLYKIDDSVKALSQGSSQISTGTSQYVDGVNRLIVQNNDIGEKIKAYVSANPTSMSDSNMSYIISVLSNPTIAESINTLTNSGNTLKSSTNTLSSNLNLLSQNTVSLSKINTGVSDLSIGLEKLSTGSNSVLSGSEKINNGFKSIAYASSQIASGISSISEGSTKVNSGTLQVKDGLSEASTKISDGIDTASTELESTNGLSEYVAGSVNVEKESINSVPNYGTAFSSYFMSISLWIGGIIIFIGIYFDIEDKFIILSRNSNNKILRSCIYFLIGIGQALLLALALQKLLHLTVTNVPAYYLSAMLVSVVFVAIIQFFMVYCKDVGKFIVILLLVLQLSSCGGTYPIELLPNFFKTLYTFMPMTYSVKLFRETISGGTLSAIMQNVYVLVFVLVLTIIITVITDKIAMILSRKKSDKLELNNI